MALETELLAAARHNGQKVANGLSVVVGQAAEAFRVIISFDLDKSRILVTQRGKIASGAVRENAE